MSRAGGGWEITDGTDRGGASRRGDGRDNRRGDGCDDGRDNGRGDGRDFTDGCDGRDSRSDHRRAICDLWDDDGRDFTDGGDDGGDSNEGRRSLNLSCRIDRVTWIRA